VCISTCSFLSFVVPAGCLFWSSLLVGCWCSSVHIQFYSFVVLRSVRLYMQTFFVLLFILFYASSFFGLFFSFPLTPLSTVNG